MNFTREPIIETIITPKEGYKLLIRSSRGSVEEEYCVNAIELVAFGQAVFFRSLERPKAFLLPVAEYEVVEIKETRMVLKKTYVEKPIKIAGGRAPSKTKENEPSVEELSLKENKQKDNKRINKRLQKKSARQSENLPSSSHVRRTLLPPPERLISEQISRYKDYLVHEEQVSLESEDKSSFSPEDFSSINESNTILDDATSLDLQEPLENKIIDLDEEASLSPMDDSDQF